MDRLLDLPTHVRRRLASALELGALPVPSSPLMLQSEVGLTNGAEEVASALEDLAGQGISGQSVAHMLRAFDHATSRAPAPDIVWSGPPVQGLHARDTRRVYEELVGTAERSFWVSTFVFFDGPRAFKSLAERMEERPNLDVKVLLNIQRRRGDTTELDDLVRMFADNFWKSEWPSENRPAVYYDPRSLDKDEPGGVLHAKAVIADEEALFVTSANLTEAAFERNIELGLLVRDRALALSVSKHFQLLIDSNKLQRLPAR